MKHLSLSVLLLVCLAVGIQAQDVDGNARLRVVHAVADAPAVDVYANDALVVEALPFKSDTGYLAVPSGIYQIEVKVAGTNTTVIREMFSLTAGVDYSSIAIGSVGASLRLLTIGDNLLPRPHGTISLRVIHAAYSAPAVDVYVGGPYSPVTGATPALVGVPFGAESGHIDLPNGVYQGRVAVSGTKTIAIDSPVLRLPNGAVRTLIAVDAPGGGSPFEIISLVDRD